MNKFQTTSLFYSNFYLWVLFNQQCFCHTSSITKTICSQNIKAGIKKTKKASHNTLDNGAHIRTMYILNKPKEKMDKIPYLRFFTIFPFCTLLNLFGGPNGGLVLKPLGPIILIGGGMGGRNIWGGGGRIPGGGGLMPGGNGGPGRIPGGGLMGIPGGGGLRRPGPIIGGPGGPGGIRIPLGGGPGRICGGCGGNGPMGRMFAGGGILPGGKGGLK